MKKVIVTLVIVIILTSSLIFGSLFIYHGNAGQPLADPTKTLNVTVQGNESLFLVLDRLAGAGELKNGWLSKLYFRLSGLNLEIEPGRHEAPGDTTLKDLLSALKSDDLDERTVTIPEGITIEQMASRFEKAELVLAEEFLLAVKSFPAPDYVPQLGERRYRLEGYLKPDTYTFAIGTPARDMIRTMSEAFTASMAGLVKDHPGVTTADYDKIITKAAMIERETNSAEERPLVASVIENRLAIKQKLQLDATVLYARGTDSKVITASDMRLAHPFNTYHVPGLPAGPICSPSDAAIRAVLAPAKTDYIYYVLNPKTGRHFFTASYDEFLVKKKEFLGRGPGEVPSPDTKPAVTVPEHPFDGPVGVPFQTIPSGDPVPSGTQAP